ncbi:MAG: Holliday junction branch migration protein RuvA [Candidatus Nanopelagicales bacterium]
MLSFISGTVHSISAQRVVLDAQGIGYEIHITPSALGLCRVGAKVQMPVLLIVREESMTLYGFSDTQERDFFQILMSVSGVGPKLALTIVSSLTQYSFATAIANKDEATLVRIPGVGKKSAARLIVELDGKFQKVAGMQNLSDDILDALTALGWSEREARAAIEKVNEMHASADITVKLRTALEVLNRVNRT